MQTAIEHYGDISKDDLVIVDLMRRWLNGLPDKGNPDYSGRHLWSCHAVCRAALSVFGLSARGWRVADGYFIRHTFQHSWLVWETTPPSKGGYRKIIIDALPVAAAGGPFIVAAENHVNPWFDAYNEDAGRYDESRCREFQIEAAALIQLSTEYKLW